MFVSALAIDATGLATLRDVARLQANIRFELDKLALPSNALITNLAVLLPGVVERTVEATLRFGTGTTTSFQIAGGLAMSNAGVLSDGNPANALPLNAAAIGSAVRPAALTITKGSNASQLAEARDALLWIEYSLP